MATTHTVIDTLNNTSAALLERETGSKVIVFTYSNGDSRIFKLYDDGTWEEIA